MTLKGDHPDAHHADALKALERFVVENDDLLELESRIGRFNVFDALGITHVEIRHSNFLAFILDPAESHGQGPLFLKAILMDLLKSAPPESRPLSPISLDGTDLRDVEVKREWKNIDLLITCGEPEFAVVMENKVGSGEHSNQLSRYAETMAQLHPNLSALFVYLTPDSDEPSHESWIPYSYGEIHHALKRIRDAHATAIGDDVLLFLDHYLNLLGTRFMNDEKLDELCRRIYKHHRQALDLIWERTSAESGMFAEVVDNLKEDDRWEVLYESGNYVDFVPKSWLKWMPPLEPDDWYQACIQIWQRETRLRCCIFVGPMADAARRTEIVNTLRDEIPAHGFRRTQSKKVDAKWSRVSSVETLVEWGEDDVPEPGEFSESVTEQLNKLYLKLEKVGAVFEPLYTNAGPSS